MRQRALRRKDRASLSRSTQLQFQIFRANLGFASFIGFNIGGEPGFGEGFFAEGGVVLGEGLANEVVAGVFQVETLGEGFEEVHGGVLVAFVIPVGIVFEKKRFQIGRFRLDALVEIDDADALGFGDGVEVGTENVFAREKGDREILAVGLHFSVPGFENGGVEFERFLPEFRGVKVGAAHGVNFVLKLVGLGAVVFPAALIGGADDHLGILAQRLHHHVGEAEFAQNARGQRHLAGGDVLQRAAFIHREQFVGQVVGQIVGAKQVDDRVQAQVSGLLLVLQVELIGAVAVRAETQHLHLVAGGVQQVVERFRVGVGRGHPLVGGVGVAEDADPDDARRLFLGKLAMLAEAVRVVENQVAFPGVRIVLPIPATARVGEDAVGVFLQGGARQIRQIRPDDADGDLRENERHHQGEAQGKEPEHDQFFHQKKGQPARPRTASR